MDLTLHQLLLAGRVYASTSITSQTLLMIGPFGKASARLAGEQWYIEVGSRNEDNDKSRGITDLIGVCFVYEPIVLDPRPWSESRYQW
ncbi:MAG: hypothetical protein CM15mP74_17730 [Halieaceae bacterium]|nr:MAG: hypothetical protein CM15mP74_17730 [Halieaceae bacterium]